MTVFFTQVESLCKEKHISPSALAKMMHLSPNASGKWRAGSLPKVETIMKIADYFDVSLDYLLHGKEHHGVNNASATNGAVSISGNGNVTGDIHTNASLDKYETELINIYRSLDVRQQAELVFRASEIKARNRE